MDTARRTPATCGPKRPALVLTVLLALGACEFEPDSLPQGSDVSSIIDLRLVREAPAPDLEAVEYEGQTLHLDPIPLLADAGVDHAEPTIRPGELFLRLELSPEVTDRMAERTASEIGSRVATLVDGRVRSVPVIRDAVGGAPRLDISIPVTGEEASRLAELIRSRWPPDASGSD